MAVSEKNKELLKMVDVKKLGTASLPKKKINKKVTKKKTGKKNTTKKY